MILKLRDLLRMVITRGFPPPSSDLASLFFAGESVRAGKLFPCRRTPIPPPSRGDHDAWSQVRRRAATALPIAMSTPKPKISVPMTLTCGGMPVFTDPTIHSGKVRVEPLTKLVTT